MIFSQQHIIMMIILKLYYLILLRQQVIKVCLVFLIKKILLLDHCLKVEKIYWLITQKRMVYFGEKIHLMMILYI